MGNAKNPNRSVLTIKLPTSVRQIRSLDCREPVDELQVSSDLHVSVVGPFHVKLAREISKWQSVRKIGLWCTATKAALRQLLATPGLEEVYVTNLHEHSSLNGMPQPNSLHTFRCGWLSSNDLLNIAALKNLVTLSAQNSQLSNAVLAELIEMKNLVDLDLEASNLDDEMAATLATSERIVRLDIGATRVGPKGLQSICQMTQLRELDIWALDIQECDLDELAALTNLEYLSVGGYDEQTVLTAKGVLPRIAQLPSLKRLWLDGIPLTKDEVAELERRYETVQVTFVE